MKVLVVEPMKECYTKEINGLEEMQALVGGYIQAIYPFPDKAAVVCNEEGKNLGLPFNRPLLDENDLPYDIICGTFFVAGLGVPSYPGCAKRPCLGRDAPHPLLSPSLLRCGRE